MKPLVRSGLAGLLMACISVPFAWSWLVPLPLAVVFLEIHRAKSARDAFLLASAAGVGFFAIHLAWLMVSFGRLFGPAGGLITLLIVPILALSWGLMAFAVVTTSTSRWRLIVLPLAWVLGEYARTLGPLAFPWGALGYAFLPTPLVQVADLGGVSLVSLLVAFTAAGLVAALQGNRTGPAVVLVLLGLAAIYGTTRPALPPPDRVALLVQGAVSPLRKAVRREQADLDQLVALTHLGLQSGRVDAVVWPESALPSPPTEERTAAMLAALHVPLVMGAPTFGRDAYWNSAYTYDAGITGRYDKVHPVPFGEFLPGRHALSALYQPVLSAIGLPGLLGVTPGRVYASLPLKQARVGAYISYESVFPQAARELTLNGAEVLMHLSNDAWFDGTSGKEQHFQMGRLRAIETRRYVLRDSNDGISGAIDPLGRVVARFPEGRHGAFRAPFRYSSLLTPYVRWGDWPVAVAALVWLTAAGIRWAGGQRATTGSGWQKAVRGDRRRCGRHERGE